MGVVGLAPGLFPCHVVLRGRMDVVGAMVALTLRSGRGDGAGLTLSTLAPCRSALCTDSWRGWSSVPSLLC